MVRSITAGFMVLLLASMIYAQNAPEAPMGYRAELTRGTSFTGFQWTPGVGDFNGKLAASVESFDPSGNDISMDLFGVNYGYFLSTGWSVEGMLDFGSSSSSQDLTGGGTNKLSATEFGISVYGKYHFEPKFEDVSAWLGVGIMFGSVSTTLETPNGEVSKVETSGSSFGIGLDFGAQYFIGKGFSLSGDYKLGFASLSKPEYTVTSGNTSTTTKGASTTLIGTMTGTLGINFYF